MNGLRGFPFAVLGLFLGFFSGFFLLIDRSILDLFLTATRFNDLLVIFLDAFASAGINLHSKKIMIVDRK